jgi:hypothetical protein
MDPQAAWMVLVDAYSAGDSQAIQDAVAALLT